MGGGSKLVYVAQNLKLLDDGPGDTKLNES